MFHRSKGQVIIPFFLPLKTFPLICEIAHEPSKEYCEGQNHGKGRSVYTVSHRPSAPRLAHEVKVHAEASETVIEVPIQPNTRSYVEV
jgi:hypothetical protein